MYLRISSAFVALGLLAGCGAESPPPPGVEVDCAIGAGAALSAVCKLERAGDEIILHHPDGGFRRLSRDPSTGALAARDGAEPLVTEAGDQGVARFSIGADQYRIPLDLLDRAP